MASVKNGFCRLKNFTLSNSALSRALAKGCVCCAADLKHFRNLKFKHSVTSYLEACEILSKCEICRDQFHKITRSIYIEALISGTEMFLQNPETILSGDFALRENEVLRNSGPPKD
jgi:hypothetical protein